MHNNQKAARRATGQWVTGRQELEEQLEDTRQCLGWAGRGSSAPSVNTVLCRSCLPALSKWLSYKHYTFACLRRVYPGAAHLTYAQFFNPPPQPTPSACNFCCTSFFIDSYNNSNMVSYFCAIFAAIYAHSRAARATEKVYSFFQGGGGTTT